MSSSFDPIRFGDIELSSRFLMGTAGYPSPQILESAIQAGQAEVLTMGIKRQAANVSAGSGKAWWDLIRKPESVFFRIQPAVERRPRPLHWLRWPGRFLRHPG